MARLSPLAAAKAEILSFPVEVKRRAAVPFRLLTFSTLYPNAAQPNHGVFVENRLRHLVASGKYRVMPCVDRVLPARS